MLTLVSPSSFLSLRRSDEDDDDVGPKPLSEELDGTGLGAAANKRNFGGALLPGEVRACVVGLGELGGVGDTTSWCGTPRVE